MESNNWVLDLAHKGTIFLDVIENVDSQMQSKLLYAVEDYQFQRVDEVRDRRVDIRSDRLRNRACRRHSSSQTFRRDLHERINWTTLLVPPLRERSEDIPALSAQILSQLTGQLGSAALNARRGCVEGVAGLFMAREYSRITKCLERVLLVTGKDAWSDEDFRFDAHIEQCVSGVRPVQRLWKRWSAITFSRCSAQNMAGSRRAKKLGIPRSSLYHKLKQYKTGQSTSSYRRWKTPTQGISGASASTLKTPPRTFLVYCPIGARH